MRTCRAHTGKRKRLQCRNKSKETYFIALLIKAFCAVFENFVKGNADSVVVLYIRIQIYLYFNAIGKISCEFYVHSL